MPSLVGGDEHGVGAVDELRIAGDVVAVGMGVQHQQFVASPGATVTATPGLDQVVDDVAQREELTLAGRAGVEQRRTVVPEEQEEERRLVVDGLVLPEDDRVVVVPEDLHVGVGVVLRRLRTVNPLRGQRLHGVNGRVGVDVGHGHSSVRRLTSRVRRTSRPGTRVRVSTRAKIAPGVPRLKACQRDGSQRWQVGHQ